ncbi:hypothetical protein GCM10009415_55090 [Chitinophaga japonensis]
MQTPCKNVLRYNGNGGPVHFLFQYPAPGAKEIRPSFERFYFYKGYVIGESAGNTFYVVDEKGGRIQKFSDGAAFESYLKENTLTPLLWTRWYDRFYDEANFRGLLLLALVMFPLTGLLLVLYLYSLYSLLLGRHKSYAVVKRVYAGGVSVFILLAALMQVFPQSI